MQLLKMALIAGLLVLASCTDGALVAPESIQAAKGGKPGKPGGGDGGGGSYTLIDLGTDLGLSDINDDGVLVVPVASTSMRICGSRTDGGSFWMMLR